MGVVPVRFLALGDSYTVGESVDPGQAWPRVLEAKLGEAGFAVETTIVATTAWTSGELRAALDAEPPEGLFDLISVQVGVNDQYRGLPIGDFRANAAAVLVRAGALGSGGILTVSIPDWGVTPFAAGRDRPGIATDVDRFNAAWRQLSESAAIPFVDVTSLSRRFPSELAADGLHPSASQYRRWVDVIAPVAGALLAKRRGSVPG